MASVSKTFNELVAFTRSTSATYVNSAGYITETPVTNYLPYSNQFDNASWAKQNTFIQTNLVLWSEQFDNATWIKGSAGVGVVPVVTANQGVAPDGTLTADRVDFNCGALTITDRSYITQAVTVTAGVAYTDSIWIKAFDTATVGKTIRFVLESGGASGTNVFTITNQWQRIVVSGAGAVAASVNVLMETRGTYTSSTTASVLVWGAQLVQGAVPGDYRATTTAALPILYPDWTGALTARKMCENTATNVQHYVNRNTAVSAGTYTYSTYFKAAERTIAMFNRTDVGGFSATYNLSTGTVTAFTGFTSARISPLGDGWYRASAVLTLAAGTTIGFSPEILNAAGLALYTGDGSSGIYLAYSQLEPGDIAGPYYDTSATLTYAQRRDYNPATLASLGLLVEESRTNLLLQSQTFDDAGWFKGQSSVTANVILGPNGIVSADKIVENTNTSPHSISQGVTTVASTVYTQSVYLKAGERTFAQVRYENGGSTVYYAASINLTDGTFTTASFGGPTSTSTTVTNAGNGWWRVAITAASNNTSWTCALFTQDTLGNNSYLGNGTSGIYVYGAQLEAGNSATSYIPTVASQVTRAADVANVNVLSPWFNQPGGTLYVEADTFEPSSLVVKNCAAINDGTSTNMHRVLSYTGKIGGNTIVAGVTSADLQPYTYTVNTPFKFAYAYATNDFAAVGNGGAPSTDPLGTLPTGLTVMGVGNLSGVIWCGHIRRITYYPQRLSNAQLQSITA